MHFTPEYLSDNKDGLEVKSFAGCIPSSPPLTIRVLSNSVKIFPYKIRRCAAPCMTIAVNDSGAIRRGVPVPGIKKLPETVSAQVRHLPPVETDAAERGVLHVILYQSIYKMVVHIGGDHAHGRVCFNQMLQQSAVLLPVQHIRQDQPYLGCPGYLAVRAA